MCIHFYPFKGMPFFELTSSWAKSEVSIASSCPYSFPKVVRHRTNFRRGFVGLAVWRWLLCFNIFFLPINKAWRYPPGPQSRSNKHLIGFFSMGTSHHVIDDYYHLDFEITACGTQTKQSGSAVYKVHI